LLQSLVGLAFQFDQLAAEIVSAPDIASKHFQQLRDNLTHDVREARQLIWDLRSPTLDRVDLSTKLRSASEQVIGTRSVRFRFAASGLPTRCSPNVDKHVLRIAREAVSNAIQHAQPTEVGMELKYDGNKVHLRVTDDGCGFNVAETGNLNGHFGLATMKERAECIGGQLRIHSAPGCGTKVEIVAPVNTASTDFLVGPTRRGTLVPDQLSSKPVAVR